MPQSLLPSQGRLRKVCLALQERAEPIYLVGGYVRDWLLGKESHDLDLAIDGNAIALARVIADAFHGSFVLLDQERDTARVIFQQGGESSNIDFARLREGDILSDLAARDFTINAIAIHIKQLDVIPPPLIDPLGSQKDIAAHAIRVASEQAFRDDPLRTLRAVRQAATLGFQIAADTEALITRDAPLIVRASRERIRDELAQLLACQATADHTRYLYRLGVLSHILPELSPLSERPLRAVEAIEDILMQSSTIIPKAHDVAQTAIQELLSPYRMSLADHFAEVLSDVRNRATLLKFAALLHHVGQASDTKGEGNAALAARCAATVLQRLHFSNREIDLAQAVIGHYPQLSLLARQEELSPRNRYRFFHRHGDAGLDIICLSLAVAWAARFYERDAVQWQRQLQVARDLLCYYHDEWPRVTALPRLLDGQGLIRELHLKAGPLIGRLLEEIREAQAVGEILSPEEALSWAADRLRRL